MPRSSAGWARSSSASRFYTIPRLRLSRYSPLAGWTAYALWTAGVTARVAAGMWGWRWREMMAFGAVSEVAAVAIFAASVYLGVPRARDDTWSDSVRLISIAGIGFSWHGASSPFPPSPKWSL